MDTYDRIKEISPEARAEAEAFIQSLTSKYTKENPAPPEEIQKGLEGILEKHQARSNQTTKISTSTVGTGRLKYALGLGILVLALYTFAPVTAVAATPTMAYTAPLYTFY